MSFFEEVYAVVARIPPGRVATYGQVALLAGRPRAARQVGWALHQCPAGRGLPCHRVVNRQGALAPGFDPLEGAAAQRRLLEAEGVAVSSEMRVDLARCQWRPPAGE